MRVLHITNSLRTGGAEKLLLETIPLFNENVTTDLLLIDGSDTPFLNELRELNCCNIFSLGNGENLYHPKWIFKIVPYLKKYDLIHVHLFPALYWSVLAKMVVVANVKMVYTEHSTTNRRRNNPLLSLADKFLYRALNKVICISDEVKQAIKNHTNLDENRLIVIANGVNLQKIFNEKPYSEEAFPISGLQHTFKLIQVSSFRYPKDQSTIIRSLTQLPENVVLILVGEGPLLEQNKQLAKSLNVDHRVFFLGVRMDVPKLLASADAVLLSSAYEGLSLSSIEGLASGKPFLASKVPGLTDIVKDAGILFPLGDDQFLANEIQQLMTNQSYYGEIVVKCVAKALQYDINKMIESQINLYESLVQN